MSAKRKETTPLGPPESRPEAESPNIIIGLGLSQVKQKYVVTRSIEETRHPAFEDFVLSTGRPSSLAYAS